MPGPWVVKKTGGGKNWHYSVVYDGDYDDVERSPENVTMMAAAPDLFNALRVSHNVVQCDLGQLCVCCAALRKAVFRS